MIFQHNLKLSEHTVDGAPLPKKESTRSKDNFHLSHTKKLFSMDGFVPCGVVMNCLPYRGSHVHFSTACSKMKTQPKMSLLTENTDLPARERWEILSLMHSPCSADFLLLAPCIHKPMKQLESLPVVFYTDK